MKDGIIFQHTCADDSDQSGIFLQIDHCRFFTSGTRIENINNAIIMMKGVANFDYTNNIMEGFWMDKFKDINQPIELGLSSTCNPDDGVGQAFNFNDNIWRDILIPDKTRAYTGFYIELKVSTYYRFPYTMNFNNNLFQNIKNQGLWLFFAKVGGTDPGVYADNIRFIDCELYFDSHDSLSNFALVRGYSHGDLHFSNFLFENITKTPTSLLAIFNYKDYKLSNCVVRNVTLVGDRDHSMFINARCSSGASAVLEGIDVDGASITGGPVFTYWARANNR